MDASAPAEPRAPRVVMVAVDAMSLDFARARLDRLPVLKRLLEEGALAELDSPGEHMTAAVWPTFAAGIDPGAHGHYFPFQWSADEMRFRRTSSGAWSRQFAFEPFWHGLAREGVPAVVLDAGFVMDDAGAPCLQISNWSYQSTDAASASDPAALAEIRRRFGRRPIGMEVPVPKTLAQSRKIRDAMIAAIESKAGALQWLMSRHEWRFFLGGFYEIHRAGHNLLVADGDFGSEADPDALIEVYEALDRQLGLLREAAADAGATFILFALHGMIPNYAQDHFMQEMLARLNAAWLGNAGGEKARPRGGSNLVTFARKHVPFGAQYALAHLLGERIQDLVVNAGLVRGLDWSKTPSFRLQSGGEGYVRFNIKGRERDGYFDPDGEEFARYKDWLKERLLEIRVAGTDDPLVADILETDDVYPGPKSALLPDLILKWAPEAPVEAIASPVIGEIRERLATGRGGNHSGDAFMLVCGPGARHPKLKDMVHIRDMRGFVEALFATDHTALTPPATNTVEEPA